MVDQKRGAVLLCSHLGNVDLCRVLSHQQRGLKLTVLVHTRHAQAFNDMLAALDPRSQMNLMQVTEMTLTTAMLLSERVAACRIRRHHAQTGCRSRASRAWRWRHFSAARPPSR
ncbi:hypothetical protein LP419_36595 [Massilia sp. H-1]|nr:hypothetical protein LP419_36595 [Massilia sp. H-1]